MVERVGRSATILSISNWSALQKRFETTELDDKIASTLCWHYTGDCSGVRTGVVRLLAFLPSQPACTIPSLSVNLLSLRKRLSQYFLGDLLLVLDAQRLTPVQSSLIESMCSRRDRFAPFVTKLI